MKRKWIIWSAFAIMPAVSALAQEYHVKVSEADEPMQTGKYLPE